LLRAAEQEKTEAVAELVLKLE